MTLEEAWQKQAKTLESYRLNQPEILKPAVKRSEAEINAEIGIGNLPAGRLAGYIRLYPEDFIVEEQTSDGKTIRVNEIIAPDSTRGERDNTLYAHLIKIGIPTNVALERLAEALAKDINRIGFAGPKEPDALTAQFITFPGPSIAIEDIQNKKIPGLYLAGLRYGAGSFAPTDSEANVFTITVRTAEPPDELKLKFKLEMLEKYGVLNYFQSQRFGGQRLLAHKLGKLVSQGRYDLAVRYFLFKSSDDDFPLITKFRKEAEKAYPDWEKIRTIYVELPYTFVNELKLIDLLASNPKNFIGGLLGVKSVVQNWVRAYSGWLFNRYLSDRSKSFGVTTESLPLLPSAEPSVLKTYQEYLATDETLDFKKHLAPFNIIPINRREAPARLWPQNANFRLFSGGAVLNFTLPKTGQASSVLANIFECREDLPVPDWVNTEKIDPKEILGQGDLKETRELLGSYYYSKLDFEI